MLSVIEAKNKTRAEFEKFATQTCVDTLRQAIRDTRQHHNSTGTLERSVEATRIDDKSYFVGTDLYYAKWVDEGRGEVRPTSKKALWGSAHGNDFWHNVGHPIMYASPTKGNHFVEEALRRLK